MRISKRAFIGLVAAVAVTVVGCGESEAEQPGDGNEPGQERIALIAKSNAGDFWIASSRGAQAAGEDLGVEVTFNGPDTENEGERQLNQLEAVINDRPAGVGFAAQNGAEEGAPRLLEEADAAGIKIVAFATPMSFSDVPFATVASNNELMGQMAADNMIRVLDGEGKVAIITNGMVGDAALRRDSFIEHIEENAPDIQVVDVQDGRADRAISMDKAQAILQAHPDLAGFFATGDHGTIAAADQVKAMGLPVKTIGIDANPELASMIEVGDVEGVVTQNAFEVGYQTVKVLVDASRGEMPDDEYIVVDSVWADQSNLDDPDVRQAMGF